MTRYPKSGKGKKWTLLELKAIPGAWAGDTINDSNGLVGDIRVASNNNITIRFKFAFRWLDKLVWYQCGNWPQINLEDTLNDARLAILGQAMRAGNALGFQFDQPKNVIDLYAGTPQQQKNILVKSSFCEAPPEGVEYKISMVGSRSGSYNFCGDEAATVLRKPIQEMRSFVFKVYGRRTSQHESST